MNKILLSIAIFASTCLTAPAQVEKDHPYFRVELKEDVVFKYVDSDDYLTIVNLQEVRVFDDKEYVARLTQYSWGYVDTTYFRTEDQTVYYYDPKSDIESINLPKKLRKRTTWFSSDHAWKYEVVQMKAKLETPERKYNKLLVIKATQLQNRDKTKAPEYMNYYKKGVGKVAGVTNGKLTTYMAYRGEKKS